MSERAGQEVKSANQWTMTYESFLPITSWQLPSEEGGVIKWGDGTIWVVMNGRYSPAEGYGESFGPWGGTNGEQDHIHILEKHEGIGWEVLTPSNFARDDQVDSDLANRVSGVGGTLRDDMMPKVSPSQISWVTDSENVLYHGNADVLYEIHKDTRTWFVHYFPYAPSGPAMTPIAGNQFMVDDDYLWWWGTDENHAVNGYPTDWVIARLCRMSRTSPYGMEIYDSFDNGAYIGAGGSRYDIASNGIAEGLSTNKVWHEDNRTSLLQDGYIYMFERDLGTAVDEDHVGTYKPSPTNGYSGIRRYNIATKTLELLYHSVVMREFNQEINGVYDREIDYGPFPHITGFGPYFALKPIIRDNWIYYVSASGEAPYWRYGHIWWAGFYVRRIPLDYLLKNKPVKHSENEPILETLSCATAPGEGWGTYAYMTDTGATFHRGGSKPIHSVPVGQMWYMDDDGSFVFLINEVSEYITAYTDACWPLVRLSPPSSDIMDISLVFEGNAMKGYAPVHGQPSKACPEVVDLA